MDYGERYCAFVDILGFSELVAGLGKGTTSFELIRDLLRTIHEPPKEDYSDFTNSDLRAQSISDAVCISTVCDQNGIRHLFFALDRLTMNLLKAGYFVRGAVVKGKLYHDERTVFGEAMIRAYRLEQDVVRMPRIMVTSDIYGDFERFRNEKRMSFEPYDRIMQAEDGLRYLHVLEEIGRRLRLLGTRENWQGKAALAEAATITAQIQRRFDASFDNPNHFAKIQWFANYWNRTVSPCRPEVRRISGPGVKSDQVDD
jgi:hypothetical protein